MRIKLLSVLLLTAFCSASAFAQEGGIKGLVVSRQDRNSIDGVKVKITSGITRNTETVRGRFELLNLPAGTYTLLFEAMDFQPVQVNVTVGDAIRDIGLVSMTSEFVPDVADMSLSEFEMETGDTQSMPVLLSARKDVFDNIADYKFSAMRFRPRGYDDGNTDIFINGIYMNDAMSGYSPWSLLSGLNDATRNQETTGGLAMPDCGVGGIAGTANINARASQMRKGFRASFVNANDNYRFRGMFTYASGVSDRGWSYAMSVSTRQGGNDWVNGMWYNSWAYFASVEKAFAHSHRLAFTFFGTPQERAVRAAATQEVYDLVGSNQYNPNWGYQGEGTGKSDQRSARIRNSHEPVAMLNYSYEPSNRFSLTAGASFRFGRNGYSALDWYDAQDPRPDYYRNLPSYFPSDEWKQGQIREGWNTDWNIRQIDWNKLYNINRNNYFDNDQDAAGTTYYNNVDVSGLTRSKYIVEERRTDQRDLNASIQIVSLVTDNGKLSAGYDFRRNRTEYFKVVKDMLGGDYYLDKNGFAERDYPTDENAMQNNLDTPNRLVKKGDKFGYDYYAHYISNRLWASYDMTVSDFIFFAALEGGRTSFWREGIYRNGLFPDDSKGDSEKQNFWTYKAKVGLSYRISGTQMISANVAAMENAPYFQGSFLSPRTRNTVIPNLTTEKVLSAELNYIMRLPRLRMRLTGFYTEIRDGVDLISFYDDLNRAFTNFAMSGINRMHAGLELGFNVPLGAGLAAEGALSYGYYIYSSNPYVTQTRDNSNEVILSKERVLWKKYKVPDTPQTAASLGLRYRGPKNIFAGVDANYFNATYISMNPLSRTDFAFVGLSKKEITEQAKQERFDNAFLLNADIGKLWYVKNYNIGFSLQVKNILNSKDIKTGGFEQMRLKANDDTGITTYERFDPKYYYMYGTTYYLNIYFRF